MGRESPQGFLAAFDQPPNLPVKLLNVDLSTVTALADLMLGIGDPLAEIVQLDFRSSAAAWKHADVMAYHALLYAHYHVPVHSIILLCVRQQHDIDHPLRRVPQGGAAMAASVSGSARRKSFSVPIWASCPWPCLADCRRTEPSPRRLTPFAGGKTTRTRERNASYEFHHR